jgi:hypothetical protein
MTEAERDAFVKDMLACSQVQALQEKVKELKRCGLIASDQQSELLERLFCDMQVSLYELQVSQE